MQASFFFCKESPRNNPPDRAWRLAALLDRKVKKTAVVVSPTPDQVEMIEHMNFDLIQIHGELSNEVLERCRLPVLRAYNLSQDPVNPQEHEKIVGYVLDAKMPGQGQTFDWSLARDFDRKGKKTDSGRRTDGGECPGRHPAGISGCGGCQYLRGEKKFPG